MSKESENTSQTKIPTISEDSSTIGEIHINHNVVASIVRLAALNIVGVAEVCTAGSIVDGIAEIFSKKNDDRGIQIDKDEVGDYKIRVRVILNLGVELAAVGNEIQQRIVEQVEKMTSKNVARVDVIIDGVRTPDEEREKKDDWEDQEELN